MLKLFLTQHQPKGTHCKGQLGMQLTQPATLPSSITSSLHTGDVTKHINADTVQDAGYATVPHNQGSKRINNVLQHTTNTDQKCAISLDSLDNSVKV